MTTEALNFIAFTPYAWSKAMFLLDRNATQVVALGVTTNTNPLLVTELVLIDQNATPNTSVPKLPLYIPNTDTLYVTVILKASESTGTVSAEDIQLAHLILTEKQQIIVCSIWNELVHDAILSVRGHIPHTVRLNISTNWLAEFQQSSQDTWKVECNTCVTVSASGDLIFFEKKETTKNTVQPYSTYTTEHDSTKSDIYGKYSSGSAYGSQSSTSAQTTPTINNIPSQKSHYVDNPEWEEVKWTNELAKVPMKDMDNYKICPVTSKLFKPKPKIYIPTESGLIPVTEYYDTDE